MNEITVSSDLSLVVNGIKCQGISITDIATVKDTKEEDSLETKLIKFIDKSEVTIENDCTVKLNMIAISNMLTADKLMSYGTSGDTLNVRLKAFLFNGEDKRVRNKALISNDQLKFDIDTEPVEETTKFKGDTDSKVNADSSKCSMSNAVNGKTKPRISSRETSECIENSSNAINNIDSNEKQSLMEIACKKQLESIRANSSIIQKEKNDGLCKMAFNKKSGYEILYKSSGKNVKYYMLKDLDNNILLDSSGNQIEGRWVDVESVKELVLKGYVLHCSLDNNNGLTQKHIEVKEIDANEKCYTNSVRGDALEYNLDTYKVVGLIFNSNKELIKVRVRILGINGEVKKSRPDEEYTLEEYSKRRKEWAQTLKKNKEKKGNVKTLQDSWSTDVYSLHYPKVHYVDWHEQYLTKGGGKLGNGITQFKSKGEQWTRFRVPENKENTNYEVVKKIFGSVIDIRIEN